MPCWRAMSRGGIVSRAASHRLAYATSPSGGRRIGPNAQPNRPSAPCPFHPLEDCVTYARERLRREARAVDHRQSCARWGGARPRLFHQPPPGGDQVARSGAQGAPRTADDRDPRAVGRAPQLPLRHGRRVDRASADRRRRIRAAGGRRGVSDAERSSRRKGSPESVFKNLP